MDGYGSYQSGYTGGTPGGPSAEYTPPPPRPPSQSSAPSPHQGKECVLHSCMSIYIAFIKNNVLGWCMYR